MKVEEVINGINLNRPIFIKNFLNKNIYGHEIKKIINILLFDNNKDDNFLIKGAYKKDLTNFNLINDIHNKLKSQNNYVLIDYLRIWKHNKNNITPYHYDGNGIDVINICIHGKKKFILTPPRTHINFPFSNISLINLAKEKIEYILEPTDLLLIPRFWYHEVTCLKDDTLTINYLITNKDAEINNQKLMIYKLHEFFNTEMSKEAIISVTKNKKINIIDFLYNYTKESTITILISLFINLVDRRINFSINNLFIILLFMINIVIHKSSLGISILFTKNYFIINSFIEYLIKKNIAN